MRRLWPPPPPTLSLLLALLWAAALCGGGAAPAPLPTAKPSSALPDRPQPAVRAGPDNAPSGTPSGGGSSVGQEARSGGGGVNVNGSMAAAPPRSEVNQPMTQRALSVLVLASAALIVYFVIRTVR